MSTVLITGASGYLGSHVLDLSLATGYKVRAVARGAKAERLQSFHSSNPNVEVISISDIAYDEFPDAFIGVDSVCHVASPVPGTGTAEFIYKTAIDGTLNVLNQAERAGICKIVVTGSIVSVYNPRNTFTDKDWNPITIEQGMASKNDSEIYIGSKTAAEQALWEWSLTHPNVDVTVINPSHNYGPLSPSFILPSPDFRALSTDTIIFNFFKPDGTIPKGPAWRYIDVRDTASAHVKALTSPPTSEVGTKRIVFSSPHRWNYRRLRQLLQDRRPELATRIIKEDRVPKEQDDELVPDIDFERIEEVLGMKKTEFHSPEQTFLDSIDSLLELEEKWKKAGYEVDISPYTG